MGLLLGINAPNVRCQTYKEVHMVSLVFFNYLLSTQLSTTSSTPHGEEGGKEFLTISNAEALAVGGLLFGLLRVKGRLIGTFCTHDCLDTSGTQATVSCLGTTVWSEEPGRP